MKKLLLVSPLPPPYGGISHWTAMVVRYAEVDGSVPIHVIDIATRHRSEFELSFTKRVVFGIPGLFRQFARVLAALLKGRVLAIHITTPGQYALARDLGFLILARLARTRSVLHIRFGRVPALLNSSGFEASMLRLGLKAASHVIAIDRMTADAIRESLPRVPVSTVPNCIDVSRLPVIPGRKAHVVLFVGWMLPAKGIEELLEAWTHIVRDDWRLRVVGPCSDEYAAELAEKYNYEGVDFLGECDNSTVLAEMASASIFCLPSHTEGFPNVVLEAMALKCAVIATPVGAIPEMLGGDAGLFVEVGNATALGGQLRALMQDAGLREQLGMRAVDKVSREYAIDRVFESLKKIWRGD